MTNPIFFIKQLPLLIAALLFCNAVSAKAPDFTYIELEYIADGDFEVSDGRLSVDLGMDGFAITGSVELGIFFFQASRMELESDEVLGAVLEDSISTIALGITFKLPNTALYALIRGRRDELSLDGGRFSQDVDGTSGGAEAGVRVNITDRFELNANIGSPALGDGTSFGVGAELRVTDKIGITLDFSSIEIEEDDIEANFDTTSIGIRYNF
jgi:opacity protein-like surface antigen